MSSLLAVPMFFNSVKECALYYYSPAGRQELSTKATTAYQAVVKVVCPVSPSLNKAKEVVALTSAQFAALVHVRKTALESAVPTMKARLAVLNGNGYGDPNALLDIAYKRCERGTDFTEYNDLQAERDRLIVEIPEAEALIANPDKLRLKMREEQLEALAGDRVQESAQISWRPYAVFALGVVTTLCYKYLRAGAQCVEPPPCPAPLPVCCYSGSNGAFSLNSSSTC